MCSNLLSKQLLLYYYNHFDVNHEQSKIYWVRNSDNMPEWMVTPISLVSLWNMGLGSQNLVVMSQLSVHTFKHTSFMTSHIRTHKKVSHLCFYWWVHFYIQAYNKSCRNNYHVKYMHTSYDCYIIHTNLYNVLYY